MSPHVLAKYISASNYEELDIVPLKIFILKG